MLTKPDVEITPEHAALADRLADISFVLEEIAEDMRSGSVPTDGPESTDVWEVIFKVNAMRRAAIEAGKTIVSVVPERKAG